MRTMKRVAAFAMTIAVMMTSGVTTKAAVTTAQPAKSSSEAQLKWANQIGTKSDWSTSTYNNLSEIAMVGNYIYAADDGQHRVIKIDKTTGTIVKSTPYKDSSYTIHYGAGIGEGDGKIFVGYENGEIQAFDEDTLESVWITDAIEKVDTKDENDQSNAVSAGFVYDDGYLYVGTGTYSGKGSYVAVTTKDEDPQQQYETKKIAWQKESDSTYYWNKAVEVGNYIIAADNSGDIKAYDKKSGEVKENGEFKLDGNFSGGIAYDESTKTIYLASKTTNLYGIKVNEDGTFGDAKTVELYKDGYVASTPEVYNGKVYISGKQPSEDYYAKGFMAVVDVASDQYKVNYTVELPAYSQCEPVVADQGNGSVNVYFTINDNPGGLYMISDSKGAVKSELQTIFEPQNEDQKEYCGATVLKLDSDKTFYYVNDSRYLFAVGKKAATPKPDTTVKPITKTQTSTRSVKLTWKKNKSAKGYVIYAKAGKGKYKKLTTVGKTTKKTVTVKSGTSYKFKVKPYKYTKKKGKKVKKYYKAYAAKAKYGSKTVKVTYKNVKGYTSYRIDMKVGNGSYKKVLTSKKTGTLTLTYTQKKAKVGKNYKFRLVGIKTVNGKSVEKTIK